MKEKISVIGAGIMGTGIAQVAATYGCTVNLIDSVPDALDRSKFNLHSVLNRLVEKDKVSKVDSNNILSKIKWSIEMEDIAASELVIEAVVEDMIVKQQLLHFWLYMDTQRVMLLMLLMVLLVSTLGHSLFLFHLILP